MLNHIHANSMNEEVFAHRRSLNRSTQNVHAGNEDKIMYQTVLNSGVGAMVVNRPDVLLNLIEEKEADSSDEETK
jgi:hypothetical protein